MDFQLMMNDIVQQARADLTEAGYEHLRTAEDVQRALARPGTTLVMVNSVCGCAGGIARPAAVLAIHSDKRPDHLVTVFAGQDQEATYQARALFGDEHLPSSPSFVLWKDGAMVAEVGRHEIEGHELASVVAQLQAQFDAHCQEV